MPSIPHLVLPIVAALALGGGASTAAAVERPGAPVAPAPEIGRGGTVVDLRLEDAAVPGLSVQVYLPEGHGGGRRYPVVYLLHGYGGGRFQWLDDGNLAARLDRLIGEGRLPPMIAVMPDGANSWYVDSASYGGPGDYETAIERDLVAAIDARYDTDPRRQARAIAGISMGGFGALRLAFKYPGTFGAVAAMSPAIWKPGALSWTHGPATMDAQAAAAKFFRTTAPAGFDVVTFESQIPFAHVAAVAAVADPPRIMLTVGDDDYFEHYDGTVEMFMDLRVAGLKPELRVADGGHDWLHWGPMAEQALQFLSRDWSPPS
jgi:enterochelin esterase family protein